MPGRSRLRYALWRVKQLLLSIGWMLAALPGLRLSLEERGLTDLGLFRWWTWHSGHRYLRGRHAPSGRPVFIKASSDPPRIAREVHALRIIADASPTEHIPDLVAYAHDGGSPAFIALGEVPGTTLSALLERGIAAGRRRALLEQLVEIGDLLQRFGIIHCDIHPGNLLVGPEARDDGAARLILIDFAYALCTNRSGPCGPDRHGASRKVLQVLGNGFNPRPFEWDDAYSLRCIAELIEPDCRTVHPELWHDLTTRIGTLVHRAYPHPPAAPTPR